MTILPGVEWRPSPNFSTPVIRPPRGIVLHTADGTFDGTCGWQANPAAQVSSYFVNGKDGRLAQCVDLDHKAWTQGAGNEAWIGIENEGHGEQGDPLTAAQIENVARIYVWLVHLYNIPVAITDDPNGAGLGWHGMGANVGWGHPGCPGQVIKDQRPQIIARTQAILGGLPSNNPGPGEEMQKFLFVDEIHAGLDAAHPREVTVQGDGSLILANGARIAGRKPVLFNHLDVLPTEMPPTWHFQGATRVENGQGSCVGVRYAATDENGSWHPYVYYFA